MMALYIGGMHQGKKTLAKHIHGENAAFVYDLQERVRDMLQNQEKPMDLLDKMQGKIITCREIGCGIVPMDALERKWREETGRLCCAIAETADLVVRVSAGIPQVLKGELP